MSHQDKLTEEKDEFVESLGLTPETIRKDLENIRDVEGFPIGDIEDILELSDPPYFTAYPNPYIKDFIEMYGTPYDEESDQYEVEPFVGDVSEGKNDRLYSLHSYHTKVPYKSIEKYIEHYTNKGDLVFDGFAGTGQTGLAAQILDRNAIVLDLGVIPSFISINYNKEHDLYEIETVFNQIMSEIKSEYEWIYQNNGKNINYTIWSEIRTCNFCENPFNVWKTAIKEIGKDFPKTFVCDNCGSEISMKDSQVLFDNNGQRTYVPVLLNVFNGRKREFEKLDKNFNNLMENIEKTPIPHWYPSYYMMFKEDKWGDRWIKQDCPGVKEVNDLFFKRPLLILSAYFEKCRNIENISLRNSLLFIGTAAMVRLTKLNRYIAKYKTNVGPYSGTLYMPPFITEMNAIRGLERKFRELCRVDFPPKKGNFIVSAQSATHLSNMHDNIVDYIFTDPPFGWNLMYSELNFIWESWLKVFTNNKSEAVVSKIQNKANEDYGQLMSEAFKEFHRILKPERWITVEFHNSSAAIWNLIQKSLVKSGFIIAQVNVLDKKKGTINQAFLDNAVKNDLVINAYKPANIFSKKFLSNAGLNMENEFIQMHLKKLPIEANIERTQQMLYSKLLAQYIQNGFEVRLDASEFYNLLKDNFIERDGYWFTDDQHTKYEKNIKKTSKIEDIDFNQTILGIRDEKSAIIWLTRFLQTPQTYDDIYINYSKNLLTSEDMIPELKAILNENFTTERGKFKLPSDLERVEKEEIRNKRLVKEFNEIMREAPSKRKIKEVRKEALLHGLVKLYKEKEVEKINLLGGCIDQKIIESDEDISAIIEWAKYN